MEEFLRRCCAPRVALLAALSCCGPALYAENTASTTSNFRSLIARGWDDANHENEFRLKIDADPDEESETPRSESGRKGRVVCKPVQQIDLTISHSEVPQLKLAPVSDTQLSDNQQVGPLAEMIRRSDLQQDVPIRSAESTEQRHAKLPSISEAALEPPIVAAPTTMGSTNPESGIAGLESGIANAQTIRLREAARLSLRKSKQRLHRRAIHSAKMYANEALRSVVAMQDASHGGNSHAKHLDVALNAIRESRDFNGQFATMDQNALGRMIAVHETTILNDVEIENLSAIEATEAYLGVARENLIQAASGAAEASDALTILGRVERESASPENAHVAAVAMTMQQAAVSISPNNMLAHRELGITYVRQGLIDLAHESLFASVAIQPTRTGYLRLLEVSRRRGDIDTAQACIVALRSESLASEIPVRTISPERFAQTHRPSPGSIPAKQTDRSAATKPLKNADSGRSRISLRSMLLFNRK